MSIKYKVIPRGQPGVPGGGAVKYYASINLTGEINMDELIRAIEKISTVSGADIRAVLYALVDVAIDELAKSNIVRLGDFGSLRMSLKSSGYATSDDVNATAVKATRVLFVPGKKLKEMQKALTYQKAG